MKNKNSLPTLSAEEEEYQDWFLHYARQLEIEHRQEMKKLTDKFCLDLLPEAAEYIPKKITEWGTELNRQMLDMSSALNSISKNVPPKYKFERWFLGQWVMCLYGPELIEAYKQISRLKRLQYLADGGEELPGYISDEQIQIANSVPLQELVSDYTDLCPSGQNFKGLCPFHKEKTPSFHIFTDDNHYHCFGCKVWGDPIEFIRETKKFNFKGAVKYLINKI